VGERKADALPVAGRAAIAGLEGVVIVLGSEKQSGQKDSYRDRPQKEK
jgi:hypothetical protein